MNIKKRYVKSTKSIKQLVTEDLRYLQKRISGKSVYANINELYLRRPKHRKGWLHY